MSDIASTVTKTKPLVKILGGRITPLDLDGTVSMLQEMISLKSRGYVCIANVHTTTLALQDAQFRRVLDSAAAVVADGMPVIWRMRAAGFPKAGRVYGADLVEATCAAGIAKGLRHGFFGGLEGVAQGMVNRLTQRYPDLRVAGVWTPGIIYPGEASPAALLETINASSCDILWVGLGAPKQELWMGRHRSQLQVPAFVGVGQAFDILAGKTRRAPDWMGRHGLEWLYRLAHDPRRLWRRYLVYNTLFLWYLLLEKLGIRFERVRP